MDCFTREQESTHHSLAGDLLSLEMSFAFTPVLLNSPTLFFISQLFFCFHLLIGEAQMLKVSMSLPGEVQSAQEMPPAPTYHPTALPREEQDL